MKNWLLAIASTFLCVPFAAAVDVDAPKQAPFAFALLEQLHDRRGNLIFSPLSARTALAMAAAGARGQTAAELNSVLNESKDKAATKPSEQQNVTLANSLWVQQGLELNGDYRTAIENRFSADLGSVDFTNDPSAAAAQINSWVADKTANKIPSLFGNGALKPDDRLIIVNAIYLKAQWEQPFKSSRTSNDTFTADSSQPIDVPMMHGIMSGRYFADDDVQMITLPYSGNELSMTILLPRRNDGLAALERSLTAEKLAQWTGHQSSEQLQIALPKWKSGTFLEMTPLLQAMGIRAAFSKAADFSGICATPLQIGQVVQRAMIEVDEAGTEAAAATGLTMKTMAMAPRKSIEVKVDHPFLYLIQSVGDDALGGERNPLMLFVGRMMDPRQS